jgi:hypothetical protein
MALEYYLEEYEKALLPSRFNKRGHGGMAVEDGVNALT